LHSRQPQVDVLRGLLDALRAGHGSVVIVTEINAPHLSMISDPGAVTGVILNAASTVG
jgi:hypothetical protein